VLRILVEARPNADRRTSFHDQFVNRRLFSTSNQRALEPQLPVGWVRRRPKLDVIIAWHGRPAMCMSDNGPELTGMTVLRFSQESQIEWHHIAPGKPTYGRPCQSITHQEQRDETLRCTGNRRLPLPQRAKWAQINTAYSAAGGMKRPGQTSCQQSICCP
jgi:hypothetical protein